MSFIAGGSAVIGHSKARALPQRHGLNFRFFCFLQRLCKVNTQTDRHALGAWQRVDLAQTVYARSQTVCAMSVKPLAARLST